MLDRYRVNVERNGTISVIDCCDHDDQKVPKVPKVVCETKIQALADLSPSMDTQRLNLSVCRLSDDSFAVIWCIDESIPRLNQFQVWKLELLAPSARDGICRLLLKGEFSHPNTGHVQYRWMADYKLLAVVYSMKGSDDEKQFPLVIDFNPSGTRMQVRTTDRQYYDGSHVHHPSSQFIIKTNGSNRTLASVCEHNFGQDLYSGTSSNTDEDREWMDAGKNVLKQIFGGAYRLSWTDRSAALSDKANLKALIDEGVFEHKHQLPDGPDGEEYYGYFVTRDGEILLRTYHETMELWDRKADSDRFILRGKITDPQLQIDPDHLYIEDDRRFVIGYCYSEVLVTIDLCTWEVSSEDTPSQYFIPRVHRQQYYDTYLPLLTTSGADRQDDDAGAPDLCTDLAKLVIDYLITDRLFPILSG